MIKCAYFPCQNYFEPVDPRQIYCCKKCSDRARSARRDRKQKESADSFVCARADCLLYTEKLKNHCDALFIVDEDQSGCSFYKERNVNRE